MVFEYMNHDLTGLLDTQGVKLNPAQIKCYMKQLLEGVCYMHKNKILHRDIKGALAALRLPWLPPGCLVLPRRRLEQPCRWASQVSFFFYCSSNHTACKTRCCG